MKNSNFEIPQKLDELFEELDTSKAGLTSVEVKKRLEKWGPNIPQKLTRISWVKIFLSQFNNALIIILILVSIFSFVVNEHLNGGIILVMLFVNSALGFFQELKAEKTLEKLKKYVVFKTKVIRDGNVESINSVKLVPGDIVLLNKGDMVPADIRLISSENFFVNESTLTGESLPVAKNHEDSKSEAPEETENLVFLGSSISSGIASGVVVHTGKNTLLGKTVSHKEHVDNETNFEKSMKKFSNFLLKFVVLLTVFVFVINTIYGRGIVTSFLLGITLALGITPEVLPIIVTIAISSAAYKLLKQKVVVRRLSALEDLGNVNILCTDKTGTITKGQLELVDFIGITGVKDLDLLRYALISNANNQAINNKLFGNPIDDATWEKRSIFKESEIGKEILFTEDFDFDTKRSEVIFKEGDRRYVISKGATESIQEISSHIKYGEKVVKMTKTQTSLLEERLLSLESKGDRVISLAIKESKGEKVSLDNCNYTFLGFLVFNDPPKKSMRSVFDKLQKLNVQLKIITGDSPIITKEICKRAGLNLVEDKIILGSELEDMSDKDYLDAIYKYNVFARVNPDQKYRIIEGLKNSGHVVGYMGDGINDVGALQIADVAISVDGASDVAKDSSDIILLKQNLRIIADSIIEGRKTFSNTIKFIINTMSSSYGNVITIAAASTFLKFIPLLPTQMLLIDSVSDFQHLTISTDNVDEDFLESPRQWDVKFLMKFMVFFGTISTIFDFALIYTLLKWNDSQALFQTIWIVESVITELVATFVVRTRRIFFRSIPSVPVILTSILSLVLVLIVPFWSKSRNIFGLEFLHLHDLVFVAVICLAYFVLLEVSKHIFYKFVHQD